MKEPNVVIAPYDDHWPEMFKTEAKHLMSILPNDVILEFHHVGGTSIPEMPARPLIDIGVMITSFDDAKAKIVPILQKEGYSYSWREDLNPAFMTFKKSNQEGVEQFCIHMVEEEHPFWDCLAFREYLKVHEAEARAYYQLKVQLSKDFAGDLAGYEKAKESYILRITEIAKKNHRF